MFRNSLRIQYVTDCTGLIKTTPDREAIKHGQMTTYLAFSFDTLLISLLSTNVGKLLLTALSRVIMIKNFDKRRSALNGPQGTPMDALRKPEKYKPIRNTGWLW